jgi:hypothetical protein
MQLAAKESRGDLGVGIELLETRERLVVGKHHQCHAERLQASDRDGGARSRRQGDAEARSGGRHVAVDLRHQAVQSDPRQVA